jgi:glycine/D-amino acid oxidase-like deaminating enzyme
MNSTAAGIARSVDAVVVGGGFYGVAIAVYLSRRRGFRRVLLVEREASLLSRSSFNNQARIHGGYHYPRSYTTAYRSRFHLPDFVRDWPDVVERNFTCLYAIARHNSKVTARQFERFCQEIGAPLEPADETLQQLFEPRLVEQVFVATEYAFNSRQLARWADDELARHGVDIALKARVTAISKSAAGGLEVKVRHDDGPAGTREEAVACRYVFNCTYSGLNHVGTTSDGPGTRLKHEIAELALMQMPPVLAGLGITVMDGPFFSLMPFPPRAMHSLSHVRYTPHLHWHDEPGIDPYLKLEAYARESRVDRMVRDASRFLPAILDARHVDSLFEVKTVLEKNEIDDGRPILFEMHGRLPGCYSVLGGKIDNIYDVLERLDAESLA